MGSPNNGSPIELSPDEFLTFKARLGHIGSVSLTIKNREHRDVYFKVKSNASRFYSVRPDTGVIKALGWMKVMINVNDDGLDKLDEIETNKHKFLILSAVASNRFEDPEKFWKNKKEGSEGIYATKLKTKVHKLTSTTASEEKLRVLLHSEKKDEKMWAVSSVSEKTVAEKIMKMVPPVIVGTDGRDRSAQCVLTEDKENDKRETDVHKEAKSATEKKLSALGLVPEKEQLDAMLSSSGLTMSGKKVELVASVSEKPAPEAKLDTMSSVLRKIVSETKSEAVTPVLEKHVPQTKLDVMSSFMGKPVPEAKLDILSSVLEKSAPEATLDVMPSALEMPVPEAKLSVMSPVSEKSMPFSKTAESTVNGLFAQYTAEMVVSLLDKMSAKDAMQFRKEMNNILGKYEEKLIDG